MLVNLPAEAGHGGRGGTVNAHAVVVALRPDLKPKGGLTAPILPRRAEGKPHALFIRALAVEAAGIPVNAADPQSQGQVRMRLQKSVVHLLRQLTQRRNYVIGIALLVGLKPVPVVVEL